MQAEGKKEGKHDPNEEESDDVMWIRDQPERDQGNPFENARMGSASPVFPVIEFFESGRIRNELEWSKLTEWCASTYPVTIVLTEPSRVIMG